MRLKAASKIMLALLFIGILTLAFNIQPVKASGTIYIRADGSIDPPTPLITTVDNLTYTFTGNIDDSIVVERDNIAVDGAGYWLQGSGVDGNGFYWSGINNVTVKNTGIKNFDYGIHLEYSSNNTVSGNNLTNNPVYGIMLFFSPNNTILGNNITNSHDGIALYGSSNNTISANNIAANSNLGIYLDSSSNNYISGNYVTANNQFGFDLSGANNNTVVGNNITNNQDAGFYLWYSSNNTISGNNITNNGDGVRLESSSNYNSISGNNVTANSWEGIWLYDSSNNTFSSNVMEGNRYSFGVAGNALSHYLQSVDTSNLVDGKPVYYFVNQSDMAVNPDAYPEIGYLGFVNCANVTVEGLNLTNNGQGLLLAFTNASKITGNNVANNLYGIWLYDSFNNALSGNNFANSEYGISLSYSFNNALSGNNVTANNVYGISLTDSSDNKFYHNNFNNAYNVYSFGSVNIWDDGYPSGGNYWSDYAGTDLHSGPYQNETGSDGIGDAAYPIGDRYPLMNPIGSSQLPIAIFTYTPEQPVKDEKITFNATSSYDRDGTVTSYKWDFGDGNITAITIPIITHAYTASGSYTVNLTVTDNDGLTHSTTKTITVTEDSTTPTTTHDYDDLWQTTDFTITLTGTDIGSGVAETYYKINDGPTKTLSADGQPLITTEGANNKLEYWSVDNADNEELPHKILTGIKLDKTYPTVETPSRTPDADVLPDQSVKVSVNVTDALSQVKNVTLYYTINDGETWTDLPMNHTVSNLYEATIPQQQAGTTVRFKIVAYDYAGNNATRDGTEPYCVYQVIPEFPMVMILPLFIVLTLLAVMFARKRKMGHVSLEAKN